MKKLTKYFCFALFSFLLFFSCSKTIEGDLIITNVNIIDVKTGNIDYNMDIVIDAEKITSIVDHEDNSNYITETIIDGSEKYLIPGLWDMHTHTWWAYQDFFPLLIANGVTGVREMFGDLETIKRIRTEIENGDIVGPMIYSSGPIVDGKPAMWPGSEEADTPEKGREIVRKQKEAGADFIKVYSFLKKDVYLAIADECKKQGITFSGHIPSIIRIKDAIEAGHHSTEHFYGILEFTSSETNRYYAQISEGTNDILLNSYTKRLRFLADTYDEKRLESLIPLVANKNFWIDPTSVVNRSFAYLNDPEFRNDDRKNYMPDYSMSGWDPSEDFRLNSRTDADYEHERAWYKRGISIMKPMLNGGAKFLAGTDYPNPYTFPGFSLHDELQIFVEEADFTPLEALQTATLNPAIFMGKEAEFGSVETGKLASLVVLNKNPLDDINNTKSINSVIVSGKYLEGQKLRNDIEEIAKLNRLPNINDALFKIIQEQDIESAITEYHNIKETQPDAYNFNVGQLNGLGYQLLGMQKIQEAIAIFKLNTKMFPDDANAFDSLGDGYVANGEKDNAIKAYETAVAKGLNVSQPKIEALREKGD